MSVQMMARVWHYKFEPNEQAVLLCLADHAHDDGSHIFPSIARTAWKTGFSERTVQRVVKELVAKGVLVVDRPAAHHSPTEYSMDLSVAERKEPFVSPHDEYRGDILTPQESGVTNEVINYSSGVTNNDSGVTNDASGVTQLCHPNHHINHHINHNLLKNKLINSETKEETVIKRKPGRPKKTSPQINEGEPHDEVGPHGRPINKNFELYRVFCELRGDDPNVAAGRDVKLKNMKQLEKEGVTHDELRALYTWVLRKWTRISEKNGEAVSLPEIYHLNRYYSQWKALQERTKLRRETIPTKPSFASESFESQIEREMQERSKAIQRE